MTGRVAPVALAVLMLVGPLAPVGAAQSDARAPDGWEPWFDPDLRVRAPINATLGDRYPEDWQGDRLVLRVLDVTELLARGGWPTDRTGRPLNFDLDPSSIRVVEPEANETVPRVVWSGTPFHASGSFDVTHQLVTVAFQLPADASEVLVYLDRTQDGTTEAPSTSPAARQQILQAIAGAGAGHVARGVVQGEVDLMIAAGHETDFTLERRTASWNTVSCSTDHVTPSHWASCSLNTNDELQPIRVHADKPVAVYAWPSNYGDTEAPGASKVIPLAGAHGDYEDTVLTAPAPGGVATLYLTSRTACEGSCQAELASTGRVVDVQAGVPTRVQIEQPTRVVSDDPIFGWVQGNGRGPALLPIATGEAGSMSAMAVPDHDDHVFSLAVTGDRKSRVTLFDEQGGFEQVRGLVDGETRHPDHVLGATAWEELPGEEELRYTLKTTNASVWPTLLEQRDEAAGPAPSGIVQLAPTTVGAAGLLAPDSRKTNSPERVSLAAQPIAGEADVTFSIEGTPVASGSLQTPSGSPDQVASTKPLVYDRNAPGEAVPVDGGIAEATGAGAPLLAYAVYEDNQGAPPDGLAPGLLGSHLASVETSVGEPDILGPLFRVQVTPEDAFVRPGETVTLALEGSGYVQNIDGTRSPLDVSLGTNVTVADDVPGPEIVLSETSTRLPLDEPGELTQVRVQIPSAFRPDALPTTYQVGVTGEPVGGGEMVTTTSSITVRVDREISLTFPDGSREASFETEDGAVTTPLVLRNLGTAEETISLSTSLPPVPGWTTSLTDARGEEVDRVALAPGDQSELTLTVEAPGDETIVLDAIVSAQSVEDSSVSDSVVATVVHGASLDVDSRIRPDLVTMPRGTQRSVDVELENHGSPVNVQIEPLQTEGLVLDANETSVNLGEPGTGLANETIPMNVTVQNNATLGAILVGTVETRIKLGDLPPVPNLISLRARVVPIHDLQVQATPDVLPGVEQTVDVPILNRGDTDDTYEFTLTSAPADWRVEAPTEVSVPRNTTRSVPVNVTVPPGTDPGSASVSFSAVAEDAEEPIEVTVPVRVLESPAYAFDLPDALSLARGEVREVTVDVSNRGNAPGEAEVQIESQGLSVEATPPQLALGPGETVPVAFAVEATETGNHTVTARIEPGDTDALDVTVGVAELGVELVSTNPSPPQAGQPFQALVDVANTGTASARDVEVALDADGERVANETIGLLSPGQSASLKLATENLPSTTAMSIQVDPDGRYDQEDASDDVLDVNRNEAPFPAFAALVAVLTALAAARRRIDR